MDQQQLVNEVRFAKLEAKIEQLEEQILALLARQPVPDNSPLTSIDDYLNEPNWDTVIFDKLLVQTVKSKARKRVYIILANSSYPVTVSEMCEAMESNKRKPQLGRQSIDATLEMFCKMNYVTKQVHQKLPKRFLVTSNNIKPPFDNRKKT